MNVFINWFVPFFCGGAVTFAGSMFLKFKAIKEGVKCLLRAEIIRQYEKWTERKYCPVYAKEALAKAYRAYHALGGNDVATELYKITMSLSSDENEDENNSI